MGLDIPSSMFLGLQARWRGEGGRGGGAKAEETEHNRI